MKIEDLGYRTHLVQLMDYYLRGRYVRVVLGYHVTEPKVLQGSMLEQQFFAVYIP